MGWSFRVAPLFCAPCVSLKCASLGKYAETSADLRHNAEKPQDLFLLLGQEFGDS